jgi:hypothetical protein
MKGDELGRIRKEGTVDYLNIMLKELSRSRQVARMSKI